MKNDLLEYRLRCEGYDGLSSIPGGKTAAEMFAAGVFEDYASLQKAQYKNTGDLNGLMNCIAKTYGIAVSIVSASFDAIAASDNIREYESLFDPAAFEQMTNLMIWDRSFYDSQKSSGVMRIDSDWLKESIVPMLYYNILVNGDFYARLILIVEDEWRIPYLEGITEEVGETLTEFFNEKADIRSDALQSEAFRKDMDLILNGIRPNDPLVITGAGWQADHVYQVFSFRFDDRYPMDAGKGYLLKQLKNTLGECYVTESGPLITCICNLSRSGKFREQGYSPLVSFLTEYVGKAGISNEYSDLFQTPSFIKQAEWALNLGNKKDPMFWYYHFSKYAFDYIFEKSTSEFSADQLIMPELMLLRQRDLEKGSELLETLRTYINNKCNGQKTASELFIHRTTFLYRMQVIHKITGLTVEAPETFKKLVVAFELLSRIDAI